MAVPIKLIDRPSLLLFDTGGSFRALTLSAVRELGLHTTPGQIRAFNAQGKSAALQTTLPSITLGGIKIPNIQFIVLPDMQALEGRESIGFDGLFALDLLHDVDYEIDISAQRLNIFSQNHCPGQVVYWPHETVAAVPFEVDSNNHVSLPVTLDGEELQGILDTGTANTALNLTVAKNKFHVDVNALDVERAGTLDGSHEVYRRRFKTLAIDGVVVTNPIIRMVPDLVDAGRPSVGNHIVRDHSGTLPQIILGMSMLSKLHMYLAFKEHKLYITAADSPKSLHAAQQQ